LLHCLLERFVFRTVCHRFTLLPGMEGPRASRLQMNVTLPGEACLWPGGWRGRMASRQVREIQVYVRQRLSQPGESK
jgi:hypothetical protein